MSDLTFIEKTKLEKLFQMGGGYVLDFSNRTLAEFVGESTGIDIHDAKYNYASGSKANRLRSFWSQEANHLVGKLTNDLLEYCRPTTGDTDRDRLFAECERIATRLRGFDLNEEAQHRCDGGRLGFEAAGAHGGLQEVVVNHYRGAHEGRRCVAEFCTKYVAVGSGF